MRILLLSAYDAASHRYWRQGLVQAFPEHEWTVLALPARYFSWRVRGNSLSWAFSEAELLSRSYDLVIATSMVDITSLRGFIPSLAATPTLVYFHENQFAYPESGREFSSVEPMILNLYNALCADMVLFNSAYNRNTLLEGAGRLLRKLPDRVPQGLIERLAERSRVLHVPLPDDSFMQEVYKAGPQDSAESGEGDAYGTPVRIVWAARWEYDKGPDRLLAILRELERRGTDYRICILGERFRNTPEEFDTIKRDFNHRLERLGYAESRQEYLDWLRRADIVLSTATHEFQGLSVLEAVAGGCIPVLPDRLVYPELFGSMYTYRDCGADIESEARAAADMIELQGRCLADGNAEVPSAKNFSWSALREEYAAIIGGRFGNATSRV